MIRAGLAKDSLIEQLREKSKRSADAASVALALMASFARKHAQATKSFEDHSGRLRAEIREGKSGRFHTFVKAYAPYASYVENGTKSHFIAARKRKMLAFKVGGRMVFRKAVLHPGARPRHFMADAEAEALGYGSGAASFEQFFATASRQVGLG